MIITINAASAGGWKRGTGGRIASRELLGLKASSSNGPAEEDSVTVVLQKCYSRVTVLQKCYRGVTVGLQ
jgi:hypothetical protein